MLPTCLQNGVLMSMSECKRQKSVTIHTDGGCAGNPGPGGWAVVLRFGEHVRELSGGDPATTNNRMELQAAISALQALKEPCNVTLFTDSEYLRQGITEWLPMWKVRNWKTLGRQPVKNEDLWRELDKAAGTHKIKWEWLKGHAGHTDNERCDQLAQAQISSLRKTYSREQLAALRDSFVASRDPNRKQTSFFSAT